VPKDLWDKYAAVMSTFHEQFCPDVDFVVRQAENLAFDFLEQLQGRELDVREGPDFQFSEALIQSLFFLKYESTLTAVVKVSRRKKVFIGEVSVDSGTVVIVDPCVANRVPNPEQSVEPYSGQYGQLTPHMIFTSTGWGDGGYPVYAYIQDDCVAEVRIEFIPRGER
jgi:hypothetical protein